MKILTLFFAYAIFVLIFSSQGLGSTIADSGPIAPLVTPDSGEVIPNQYIVVMKEGISTSEIRTDYLSLVESLGGEILYAYENVLSGFSAVLSAEALEEIRNDPQIDYVAADMVISVDDDENDAEDYIEGYVEGDVDFEKEAVQASPTWGLDRIDQRYLPLNGSYTYNSDGSGVHVYIIDTGVRASHVEFTDRMKGGFTAINDGRGTNDCNGHGTHVAGTVAGKTYGVAKNAFIHPVRVLGCDGRGYTSGVIAGMDWVTSNHVKPAVVNMSLGGSAYSPIDSAISKLTGRGITVVVAAGNETDNACYYSPARAASAITVGATTSSDQRASYSNYGSCLDIFAPGSSILSAGITSNSASTYKSGTSMASPHVAGVAALYLQIYPLAKPAEVTSGITSVATTGVVINPGSYSPNRLSFSGMGTGKYIPSLVSPNGNVFTKTPVYKWQHILAAKYRFELFKDGILVYSTLVKGSQCGKEYCSFTPDITLGMEKSYTWRVRAFFTTYWGSYSPNNNFTVFSKGFLSTFDTTDNKWIPVNDIWKVVDPGYLKVNGNPLIISSIKEKNLFPAGYIYEVKMKRKVNTAYPNYVIFYGNPAIPNSAGWWDGYHFSFTNWQSYELRKITNQIEVLRETGYSTAIKPYDWNTVTVWTDFPYIDIWINGEYIGYYYDSNSRLGYVGIGMFMNNSGDKQPLLVDKAKLSYSNLPPYNLPLTDMGEHIDTYEIVLEEGTNDFTLNEP